MHKRNIKILLTIFLLSVTYISFSQVIVRTTGNANLTCIEVNNEAESTAALGWEIDETSNYSQSCSTLGVDDFVSDTNFKILENPINDNNLRFISSQLGEISIYSLTGELLLKTPSLNKGENVVSLAGLQSNMYIVILDTSNSSAVSKIIIK